MKILENLQELIDNSSGKTEELAAVLDCFSGHLTGNRKTIRVSNVDAFGGKIFSLECKTLQDRPSRLWWLAPTWRPFVYTYYSPGSSVYVLGSFIDRTPGVSTLTTPNLEEIVDQLILAVENH